MLGALCSKFLISLCSRFRKFDSIIRFCIKCKRLYLERDTLSKIKKLLDTKANIKHKLKKVSSGYVLHTGNSKNSRSSMNIKK